MTIVIPTWQRAQWLFRCLRAALVQLPPPVEVVVVGRTEDSQAQIVTKQAAADSAVPVRWVEIDRPGHVPPVKAGLVAARGDIVAFLDDDAEPQPGWLGALLEPFDDPRVACVGGRVLTADFRGIVHRDAGRIRWYGKYVGNVGALEVAAPVDVDGVMEGNWAWRHDVLAGLEFDPVLDFYDASMYGLDLCLQSRERNLRVVYQPAARVIHHEAPRDPALDRGDRVRRVHCYSRNYTYIALRRFRALRRWIFLLWWWLVGERGSYGVAKGVIDLMLRGSFEWPFVSASFAGKGEGLTVWRQGKQSRLRDPM